MKKNVLYSIIAVILMSAGIYIGQTMNKNGVAPSETANETKERTSTTGSAVGTTPATGNTSSKKNTTNTWAKLAEKYGDGRTKLSKKITEDMSYLLNDAMELADLGAKMSGQTDAKSFAANGVMQGMSRRLGLTEEQQEKAKPIIAARIDERTQAVSSLADAMKNDPEMMMETILAGDALSRNMISQEEYDAIAKDTLAVMRNVGGFALGGRTGNDFADPLLVEQLNGILSPEQQQTLSKLSQEAIAAAESNKNALPMQNGNLPAMELEKLESTMLGAKKLTTGLRGMIEGLQGMKDAFPQGGDKE